MPLMKTFYEITYRYFRAPWDIGPRKELIELVETGRIKPGRAIDLGSGTASNAIYLAQHGFDVTGIDYATAAIELGRKRAAKAGAQVNFIVDDLTHLQHVSGTFDLLVDYGVLDDLVTKDRDLYVKNVVPLAHAGTQFVLYCFEWTPRRWERWLGLPNREMLAPGEAERRFGEFFDIECYARSVNYKKWPAGQAVYLMTRKAN
jgi:SAM-dependent methyltransferase